MPFFVLLISGSGGMQLPMTCEEELVSLYVYPLLFPVPKAWSNVFPFLHFPLISILSIPFLFSFLF